MIFLMRTIFFFPIPFQSALFVKKTNFNFCSISYIEFLFLSNLSPKKQGFLPFLNYLC